MIPGDLAMSPVCAPPTSTPSVTSSPSEWAPTFKRPERVELLSHLTTWCPGCGTELSLADCMSVSLVSFDGPSHTEWQCAPCARETYSPETPVHLTSRCA